MTNPKSLPDAVERVTLLPCPFCGEAAKLCRDTDRHKNDGEWDVACIGCGAEIRKESTPESAARQWNTRAAEAQLDKLETEKARLTADRQRWMDMHDDVRRGSEILLDRIAIEKAVKESAEASNASLVGALRAIAGWEDVSSAEWDREFPQWNERFKRLNAHFGNETLAFRDLAIEIARDALRPLEAASE